MEICSCEGAGLGLNARSVDHLEPAAAVQRAQLSAGPCRSGSEGVAHDLLERRRRQFDHFREAERGAISVGAILHRPPQFAIDGDEIPRGSRTCAIDQDRVAGMGTRAEQVLGVIDRKRIRIAAGSVSPGSEQIVQTVVLRDGHIGQFEA